MFKIIKIIKFYNLNFNYYFILKNLRNYLNLFKNKRIILSLFIKILFL